MKLVKTLIAIVALLMVGCGGDTKKPAEDSPESNQTSVAPLETNQSSAETPEAKTAEVAKVVVDGDKIELRDGLFYFKGEPFTGGAVEKADNGQKEWEATFKDGKKHGLWTEWYENGQKQLEATFKVGELISYKEWDEDGNPLGQDE